MPKAKTQPTVSSIKMALRESTAKAKRVVIKAVDPQKTADVKIEIAELRPMPQEIAEIVDSMITAQIQKRACSIVSMDTKLGTRTQVTGKHISSDCEDLEVENKSMRVPFKAMSLLAVFAIKGRPGQKTSQRSYIDWVTMEILKAPKDLMVNPLDTEITVLCPSVALHDTIELSAKQERRDKKLYKAAQRRHKATASMCSDAAILKANGV